MGICILLLLSLILTVQGVFALNSDTSGDLGISMSLNPGILSSGSGFSGYTNISSTPAGATGMTSDNVDVGGMIDGIMLWIVIGTIIPIVIVVIVVIYLIRKLRKPSNNEFDEEF